MNIQLITFWYNEEFLAPFFLNHYNWVDKIHIILDADTNDGTEAIARTYSNVEIERFQFPDMMDDVIKSTVISQKYQSLRTADYVIIVDSDEFIAPFDLYITVRQHLEATMFDAYFVNLWQIYKHESDPPLDPSIPAIIQRRHGNPEMETAENIGYMKPIVVRSGLDIFWGIGNHYIVKNGLKLEWKSRNLASKTTLHIATEKNDMLQGAHWRLVDLKQTIHRRIVNRKERQSAVNLDKGLTAHYHQITEEDIIREYGNHLHDPVVIQLTTPPLPEIRQIELIKLYFQQAGNFFSDGNNKDAQTLYRKCLQIMPGFHDARLNLAQIFAVSGDFVSACRELTIILCKEPDNLKARTMLAFALLKRGLHQEGLEQFVLVQLQQPDNPEIIHGIAETLYKLQRYNEARRWIEKLLELQPDDFRSLLTLAAIERTENPRCSLSIYRRLLEIKPDDHQTRLFYATLLLSLGKFADGWREFEGRIPSLQMSEDILTLPRWHGQPLHGKGIVLVAEQGHGDAIQFCRYATLVAGLGARVMILCHNDQIRPLLATVEGVEAAIIPKEPLPFIPDYYCPLMSLPFEFKTTLETIPVAPAYLKPDKTKKEIWQQRLDLHPNLKVGIVWGGNRAQTDNYRRSVPFEELRSLFQTPNVTFFSLQVGPDALKYQTHSGLEILDYSDELNDFSDTAALLSSLDLVISICSAVTHLSGAIGIPTWVMLQYDADWRWMRNRNASPWYPSLRLFRQTEPGGWKTVLEQIKSGITEFSTIPYPHAWNRQADSKNDPAWLYQQGLSFFNSGNLQAAKTRFQQALYFEPRDADALNGLGTILDLDGDSEEAVTLYLQALVTDPDNHIILFNLANTLRKTGSKEDAEALYLRTIELQPDFYQGWSGLGNLMLQMDRSNEAEKILLRALQINPNQPDTLCDLAIVALGRNDIDLAERRFKQVFEIDSRHPAALNHFGMLLMRQNRLEESEYYLRAAIEAKPDYWLALNNLGVLLHWTDRLPESEACHRRVIAAQPDNATSHFNLSLVLLSERKFAEGWREYEYRFSKENPVPIRHANLPRWQGEALNGKTILIYAEQGYGDTIQFARYLPMLVEMGGRVILECQDTIIAPLFEGLHGIERLVVLNETPSSADFQLPLMSLPLLLGENAWHEPVAIRYLSASADKTTLWLERLAALPGYKVGLVWSGRRGQDNNHNRMIPPDTFASLAGIEGVSFVNLLVGVDDPQADIALASLEMFDIRKEIKTFADTAAILASLDLLISVDTATPHLAGAIGVEAWVMIPYNADWRWTFGLPDSPLYPSVKLYRQAKPFAWQPVLNSVRGDLIKRLKQKSVSSEEILKTAHVLRDAFNWVGAMEIYRRLLAKEPANLEAMTGVAACLQMLNRCEEAIDLYHKALIQYPDDPTLHCNLGLSLLTAGRYQEGWNELQWRKRMIFQDFPPTPFLTPEKMREISGKTLLIHTEQGFGDTIQMIRYIPLLAEKGVRVIVSLPPELERLVSFVPGVASVIVHGELLPLTDFQTMMADLPWLFGTTPETVPASFPYITLPEKLLETWRAKVEETNSTNTGLLWACGGENRLNRDLRSIPFDRFAEFIKSEQEVQFYSLQIGDAALSVNEQELYSNLHDLTGEIIDFADTAGLISQLDSIVTVDSAVAHLAGALGKPVNLLLPEFREWRWIEVDERSLWYPSVIIKNKNISLQKDFINQKGRKSEETKPCHLCKSAAVLFYKDKRPFYLCPECGLISTNNYLSMVQSEMHYRCQHDNPSDYKGYVEKILNIIHPFAVPKSVFDFGSGSGKLSETLKNFVYSVDQYEPMLDGEFKRNRYAAEYDLVIANEVIEHIEEIVGTFDQIHSLCKPGGVVYISTLTTDELINTPENFRERFKNWWYKDDLTHVSFYCRKSIDYICNLVERYSFTVAGYGPTSILLKKRKI